jgi:hypothetical protein
VVRTAKELARAAVHAIQAPGELSSTRRRIAGEMFFEPGGATDRAVTLVRRMLHVAHAGAVHA